MMLSKYQIWDENRFLIADTVQTCLFAFYQPPLHNLIWMQTFSHAILLTNQPGMLIPKIT